MSLLALAVPHEVSSLHAFAHTYNSLIKEIYFNIEMCQITIINRKEPLILCKDYSSHFLYI